MRPGHVDQEDEEEGEESVPGGENQSWKEFHFISGFLSRKDKYLPMGTNSAKKQKTNLNCALGSFINCKTTFPDKID